MNDYDRCDENNDVRFNRRNESHTAGHGSGSREGSYASAVRGLNQSESGSSRDPNYSSEPIHERISLSRRNSRRNISGTRGRDRPPNTRSVDPREAELEDLRSKLRTYEAQNGSQPSNSQANQSPKNVTPAQRETGQNPNNEIAGMRNYLAEVMAAIRGFDSRLSTQQEQQPTPSDRS